MILHFSHLEAMLESLIRGFIQLFNHHVHVDRVLLLLFDWDPIISFKRNGVSIILDKEKRKEEKNKTTIVDLRAFLHHRITAKTCDGLACGATHVLVVTREGHAKDLTLGLM